MGHERPRLDYENYSVEYLKRRLQVFENLKIKFAKFTLASNTASILMMTAATLTENEQVSNYEAAMAIGGLLVTAIGCIKTIVNFNESNRIIYAAKSKGVKIEGLLERRIVD